MDVLTLARTARENLARGLGALQTPGLPPQLGQAAEPIAHAMSALHRIESARGVGAGEAAAAALGYARQALGLLQTAQVTHPAVDQALEAIASSLGLVHQVTGLIAQPSLAPAPPTQQSPAWPQQPPAAPAVAHAPANAVAATQLAPAWPAQATAPAWPAAPVAAAPQPAAPVYQAPPPAAAAPAPAAGAPAAVRGGANTLRIEADLGAHSATNFYKGLSGNDVIDSGGIFVATYTIPEVGQELVIRVSMPGGYEFEALGVVRWSRDAPNSGADAPPGFGAQFTQIAPEARQLVYRYVRNREPLFHDDL